MTHKAHRRATAAFRGIALTPLLLVGCAFLFSEDSAITRTVHVKVVADRDFAANNSLWRENAINLISNASRVYKSWANVVFVIDTAIVWDIEDFPSLDDYYSTDCIVKGVPNDDYET